MTFHEHVEDLSKHLIFRNGASYRFQRYGLAIHDKSEHGVYRLRCGVGSSLDEGQILPHLPYPLEGTCLHGNDPSDRKFYKVQLMQLVAYKRVGSLLLLLYQRYNVPTHDG